MSQPTDIETKLREAMDGVTPGPWLAAAGPSSIVGWPIVAQSGRLICNLATPPKDIHRVGREKIAYDAFMSEVRATGIFIALCSPDNIGTLLDTIAALRKQVSGAVGERDRQMRRATNAEYMAAAYRNMLGPKGLEVAAMWDRAHVDRVHFDWGPDALKLSGEQRAEAIIGMSIAPSRQVCAEEIDGHSATLTGGKADA